MKRSLGVYIHIPFCLRKCLYCDFCSFSDKEGRLMEKYTLELCRRIRAFSSKASDHTVDTVYFGGGTPTLLPIFCFEKIFGTLHESFDISDNCEITVECNPATADLEYFSALRSLGVNRLSIGLQSVHENELSALGRIHGYEDFKKTFSEARDAGFHNISADLMYGIPNQTLESFRESLSSLAKLHPEHISAYGLKIEGGTPFHKMKNSLSLPDEDTEYEMYLACSEILSDYGYKKYEISNFSLDGRESRHNLRYWQGLDYIGFGVAAHSLFEGRRFGNSRDIGAFLQGKEIISEESTQTETDDFNDFIMLSLRLTRGLSLEEFKKRGGMDIYEYYPPLRELVSRGFMKIEKGYLSFTDRGFFVSNTILSDMLDLG